MATKHLLTKSQINKNQNLLDKMADLDYNCGSDCLFLDNVLTDAEMKREWAGYLKNIAKMKKLASELQLPEETI